MSTVITIHRGEILQIQRMIRKFSKYEGDLYGLLTESYQPVILIVDGGRNRDCAKSLNESHGLIKLGEWSARENDKEQEDESSNDTNRLMRKTNGSNGGKENEVSLVFNREGEIVEFRIGGLSAESDIIEDQSAFRLFKPVTDMLKANTELESSIIEIVKEPVKEAKVKATQWYSTEEGMGILREIYARLPEFGFQIQNMQRDISTQDMTIYIEETQTNKGITISFPNDFPTSKPNITVYLSNRDDRNGKLEMEVNPLSQPDEVIESFFSSLVTLCSSTNDEGNDMQQGSGKDSKSTSKVNDGSYANEGYMPDQGQWTQKDDRPGQSESMSSAKPANNKHDPSSTENEVKSIPTKTHKTEGHDPNMDSVNTEPGETGISKLGTTGAPSREVDATNLENDNEDESQMEVDEATPTEKKPTGNPSGEMDGTNPEETKNEDKLQKKVYEVTPSSEPENKPATGDPSGEVDRETQDEDTHL